MTYTKHKGWTIRKNKAGDYFVNKVLHEVYGPLRTLKECEYVIDFLISFNEARGQGKRTHPVNDLEIAGENYPVISNGSDYDERTEDSEQS